MTIPILRAPISAARRIKRKLQRGELSFGLREAVIVSIAGIAIAIAAAYHYSR